MKYFFLPLLLTLMLGGTACQAQKASKEKALLQTEFKVEGVCGMCADRIENALSVRGVKTAQWDQDTKMATVIYNPAKISVKKMESLVAEIGHDTEGTKATDDAYSNLHTCCKYRDGATCDD